jgi:glycogen debranching enzyme
MNETEPSRDAVRVSKLVLITALLVCLVTFGAAQVSSGEGTHAANATSSALTWNGTLEHRFLSSVGKRGFLYTIGPEGAEGYLYPFRMFHDLRVTFQIAGGEKLIEGRECGRTATVTPSSITRHYVADGLAVRETLFVPLDEPALIITYEVDSAEPVDINLALRPDMDLMWPAGMGGQTYSWDEAHKSFLIDEPSGRYRARIGSPAAVWHSEPADRSHPWITDKILSLRLHALPHTVVPLVATIRLPKQYDDLEIYEAAGKQYGSWMQQADSYYRRLRNDRLQIITGEPEIDNALAWATVALDQAEGCNTDLGCGLLAGYGPTWDTRRPQYAWFFAGDALVTSWALEAEGAHGETVRALSFIRKYQDRNSGAIWHEISQSASFVDWFHLYPYIYRHTDISPLYLLAMRNIWESSGDRALLDKSWPSLESAWRFCLDHVDPEDGLIVIPPEQSGVNENEADRTQKELPLELAWVAGADAFSELAAATGHPSESEQGSSASDRARASLKEFWDPVRNYYFEGLRADMKPLQQQMASPAWGVAQGLLPARERDLVLDRLAQPAFRTDWGLRSIPSDDPAYQPDSYAHGSVWPVGTETYILATLVAHRPEQAWPMWYSLVNDSFVGSPGHIPEVLSGTANVPLDVSVPEQTWSSAALMTATVRGILGLDPDVPHNKLRFQPHLPPQLNIVSIRNFHFGSRTVQFTLQRSSSGIEVSVVNSGEPFELEFVPQLLFSGDQVRGFLNTKEVPVRMIPGEHDRHAALSFEVHQSEQVRIVAGDNSR